MRLKAPRQEPSAEELRRLFVYDPETGHLTRRVSVGSSLAGSRAGCLRPDGYVDVSVGDRCHKVHRIAWAMANRPVPDGYVVDHINGVKSDNRLCNLRLATKAQNAQNIAATAYGNGNGLLGGHRHGGRFRARIRVNGRRISLGAFKTKAEAADAYIKAKRAMHSHFVGEA